MASGCNAPALDGAWRGGVHQRGWQAARLELHQDGRALRGRMDVPALGIREAPVTGSIDGSELRLRVDDAIEPLDLHGSVEDGVLRSSAEPWGLGFHFVRALPSASPCEGCLGWYEWKPSEALLVSNDPEGGLHFSYLGRLSGTLLPIARDTY